MMQIIYKKDNAYFTNKNSTRRFFNLPPSELFPEMGVLSPIPKVVNRLRLMPFDTKKSATDRARISDSILLKLPKPTSSVCPTIRKFKEGFFCKASTILFKVKYDDRNNRALFVSKLMCLKEKILFV
jgi:hypothetical protein